ncbi:MAG TPA: hypothetical protein VJ246_03240 [Patescibacteria group bacterium]|nr:hypothetical protein [Patescibacteria group bacterium]
MGLFVHSFGITDNVPSHGGKEADNFAGRWQMEQDRLGGMLDEMVSSQKFYRDISVVRRELKDSKFELAQYPTSDPNVIEALREAGRLPINSGFSVYGIRAYGQGSLEMGHVVFKE